MDEAHRSFTTAHTPAQTRVGGKGAGLIEMTRSDLPVPPGFVLTTDFFQPWLEQLRSTAEWDAFAAALSTDQPSDEQLRNRTAELQTACQGFSVTDEQQRQLSRALEELPGVRSDPPSGLFAVRSSAPQEDLAGASFAGVYESVLGVAPDALLEAVRTVFASSLDVKAVSYKRHRGFDPTEVEIAVVVQQQVDSACAGVAFSLNPQNNDYDQAVIQANWGLGETVVSGDVTPDTFIVDTVAQRVLEKKLGSKETALWSAPGGGAEQPRDEHRTDSNRLVLSDAQAVEIARMAQRAETITAGPADVEWAYDAEGTLRLLQARPVTTYFPLVEQLCTAPAEPRRLYADGTLLEEGLQEPLSVLGERWMADAIVEMIRQITGQRVSTQARDGLVRTVGGRWYADLSTVLWLGTERIAQSLEPLDVHAAAVLRNVDEQRYRNAGRKPTVRGIAQFASGTIAHSAGLLGRVLVALVAPDRARQRYEAAVARHRQRLAQVDRRVRSVPHLGGHTLRATIPLLMRESLPLTGAAEVATSLLQWLYRRASTQQRRLLETALRSMPHNITIDMGLALYRLARSLEHAEGQAAFGDLPTLARRIEARELSPSFLREWDAFMDSYGFRGPTELDLAAARYADDPVLVLEQMRHYVLLDESVQETPEQSYERRQRERREAYRELRESTRNPFKARLVSRLYRVAETFSGLRESHKYHLVLASYQLRRRALDVGSDLVERGQLDSTEQVFDLTYDNLEAPEQDLRAQARSNTRYRRQVAQTPGARFPVVVDSRGRIPHPVSRAAGAGALAGEGVSTGLARGPAKVLRHVGEKPVLPGDILVARATDPGWTPLFVNAAGVVLETGGSFQHGALVAREYGTPCVVGIENATEQITDGQTVELDGTAGTITRVSS